MTSLSYGHLVYRHVFRWKRKEWKSTVDRAKKGRESIAIHQVQGVEKRFNSEHENELSYVRMHMNIYIYIHPHQHHRYRCKITWDTRSHLIIPNSWTLALKLCEFWEKDMGRHISPVSESSPQYRCTKTKMGITKENSHFTSYSWRFHSKKYPLSSLLYILFL